MLTTCVKIGVGGPGGAGKTAILGTLCKRLRDRYDIAVITNDIYNREDASINITAVKHMPDRFPDLSLLFVESGGDHLAASFSPELVGVSIYVIDISGDDKIPRKGGHW